PAMGSGAFLVEVMRQLARLLVEAWTRHGKPPRIPSDETPMLFASRMIAQRCLYGVDKNRMAVDLAKLSLWLATLAKDHAFTFLDHALRCGDSLVGLTQRQIGGFAWESSGQQRFFVGDKVAEATKLRTEIREAPDDSDIDALR